MTFRIRPTRIPADVAPVADIVRLFDPEGMTPEELAKSWAKVPEGGIRLHLVAETDGGRIIAASSALRNPWDAPGRWFGKLNVHPGFQRQGVGSALLGETVRFMREHGGTRLSGSVRDNDADSLRWLQARGGKVERHLFESTLDVDAFDERPFAGAVAASEATGIRFLTLADEPGEKWLRSLYDLVSKTTMEIPGFDIVQFEPFEDWCQGRDVKTHPPDCVWLAADGDRVVGTTGMQIKASGAMYTYYTSVDPDYRGRGIALALKLLSVRTARRYGVHRMRTNNDALNAPMLAVNRKLGYLPEPGIYLVDLYL